MSANHFDSSSYGEQRPDLLNNWQRANDPEWLAQNPDSQGVADYINSFGSLDAYLNADYSNSNPITARNDPPEPVPNNNSGGASGNPFDPPGSSIGTENNVLPYVPPDGSIPINNDPNVVGSSTYNPLEGITPNNTIPINSGDVINQGGGMPGGSGGGGIFGGNGGTIIPIPGIDPITAIAGSILLSNGNIFGGGGSGGVGGLVNQVGNIASNPIGAIDSSVTNLGNSIMGPQPINGGTAAAAIPISFPSGNGSNTPPIVTSNSPLTPPGPAPTNPTDAGNSTIVAPVTGQQVQQQNQQTVLNTQTPSDSNNPVTVLPTPVVTPPGPAPTNPTTGTDNNTSPTILPPSPVSPITPPGPAPINPTVPTQTDTSNPTTVVIPVTPPTTGGSTTTNPTVTTVPTTTVPTDTSIVSPLDRNLLTEGNTSNTDLQSFLSSIMGNYGGASGSAGQTDFTNWQNILRQFGGQNSNLTGLANTQTQAANTALRTNNLNDVQNLLPQATAIRNAANPGLLGDSGSLQNYSNGAASFLSQAQQQQNDANFLSPQEMNTAQQTARNAWSARGLVNSPGAVGAEILNTDSALRARQQQAFTNTQGALNTYGQSVGAQQQNVFDPFGAILGGQYGQQTSNAGSNANLYGQSSAFSSGQQGNAYAQNVTNPFSPYIQDLNSGNFNAANARNIAASNNAAAVQGANTAQNSALANSFLRLFGQSLAGTCWVARSVFGADNPQWLLFRHWLLTRSPSWFRNLYMKHGEKFALWLDKNSWLKPVIRRFMESRIKTLYASGLRGSHDAGFGYGYKMKGGC